MKPEDIEKRIAPAAESLDEILKRIGPYIPKPVKIDPPPKREWQTSKNRRVPLPCNSKEA